MKEYLIKYRRHLWVTGLLVFLLHGAKLNSNIVGIDTEDLIHLQDGFYGGWLHTGRQGLVLLKYLLGNERFNPYFSGAVTLFLFTTAVVSFLLVWDKAGCGYKRSGSAWAWGLGGLLWISHPIMVEQFYFSLQSMEICIGLFLTAAALYMSFKWAGGCRVVLAAGSVGLLILVFSCYQIFVVLYIFGTAAVVLLQAIQDTPENTAASGLDLLKRVFPYFVVFMAAFISNSLITRLFFSSSDYLQNQIFWGQWSIKDCLRTIAAHVIRAFTGQASVFFNAGLGALALFDLILLVILLQNGRHRRKNGAKAMIVFFYLGLLTTPFMMTMVLGAAPAVRSQLVMPAATGFLGYLSVELFQLLNERFGCKWQGKAVFCCGAAICFLSGIAQAKVTEGLYYTDRCRYEQDAALGRSIIERIEQVNWSGYNLPVVVVGNREFSGNNACIMGEVIGRSFFAYDMEVEPEGFWSTRRVVGFFHTLGADYNLVPQERIEEAFEYSTFMPEWPAEGSVQEKDGMIIVKLSHYGDEDEKH